MSCEHNGGFGASSSCPQCVAALAAIVPPQPPRFEPAHERAERRGPLCPREFCTCSCHDEPVINEDAVRAVVTFTGLELFQNRTAAQLNDLLDARMAVVRIKLKRLIEQATGAKL